MTFKAHRGLVITAVAMSWILAGCGSVTSATDAAGKRDAPGGVADAPSGHGDAARGKDAATADAPTADAVPAPDATTCGASSVCVEAPQSGWMGPAIFFEGATSASAPACTGDYPTTDMFNGSLDGGTASCTCSCAAATGTSCGSALLYPQTSSTCSDKLVSPDQLPPKQCVGLGSKGAYYTLRAAKVSGGSCTASVQKSIPTATWGTQVDVCTGSGFSSTGCSANQLCVPRPSAPFDSKICIFAAGDIACPAGSAYSTRIVRYSSFSDTRDCASCSCGAPSGSCGGAATLAHDAFKSTNICTAATEPMVDGRVPAGGCLHAPAATYASYVPSPTATCQPSMGTVTGSLSPTEPTTFCCLTP